SLRRRVHLEAGGTAHLAFVTGACDSLAAAQAIAELYASMDEVDQTLSDAFRAYRTELQDTGLTADEVALANRLAGCIVFTNPGMRETRSRGSGHFDRTALWSLGISGDLPIVLVRIDGDEDENLVREVTMVHDFSRRRGLQFDLVLFDERGADSVERLGKKLS